MKAARLHSLQQIEIEEIPIPKIRSDEALVRLRACGICGSDTMAWYVKNKAPFCPGHEPAGIVEEVGDRVTAFKKGDRVFIHHHAPCFECKYCQRKQYSLCAVWKATNLDPGGMSEFVRVPAINLKGDTLLLPDSLSFEDGALIEPTACAVKSLRKGSLTPTDTVLVIGLGVMGQMHILLARHYGVKRIIGADLVPYRLQKAKEFGADTAIDVSRKDLAHEVLALTEREGADLVIVGPGTLPAMTAALRAVAKGGRVLFFTPSSPAEMLPINPFELYFNEVDLIFSYSCGPEDTHEAMSLIEKGVLNAEMLVTHRFEIDDIQQAVDNAVQARDSLKTLVVF